MQCSRSEFFSAIEGWHDSSCAVHLHTDEVSGAFVVTFRSASKKGVLEFSAHAMLRVFLEASRIGATVSVILASLTTPFSPLTIRVAGVVVR
jgi:hypothetical protein